MNNKSNKIRYKILIIDDNDTFANDLKRAINKYSDYEIEYDVDTGTRISEITFHLENSVYDLITIDMCYTQNQFFENRMLNEAKLYLFDRNAYGLELYQKIRVHPNNHIAKRFIISNVAKKGFRENYGIDSDTEIFWKKKYTESTIAQHIDNYFRSGRNSIYNYVFVAYGHDLEMRDKVESFLKTQGINAINLHSNRFGANTVLETLNNVANKAESAIVLLSGDDLSLDLENNIIKSRARQNVIFELGLFVGTLGKEKVIAVYKDNKNFEKPSDIEGIFHVEYKDNSILWKSELAQLLNNIGFCIDLDQTF